MDSETRKLIESAKRDFLAIDTRGYALAEKLWKLNKEKGISHRDLGDIFARSHSTIGRYVRVWEKWNCAVPAERPSFTTAYYEVGDLPPSKRPQLTPDHPATRPASEPLSITRPKFPTGIALPALMRELDRVIERMVRLHTDSSDTEREAINFEYQKRAVAIMDIVVNEGAAA